MIIFISQDEADELERTSPAQIIAASFTAKARAQTQEPKREGPRHWTEQLNEQLESRVSIVDPDAGWAGRVAR